ncbi:MAG: NAD(P)/FAD-dependent oxidoreductase, partial [Lachnospiraceae bacterium]
FTHFGVSGPLVLTASAKIGGKIGKEELSFTVDLKPAVSVEELDQRMRGLLEESPTKALKNALAPMYPSSLLPVLLELAGVDRKENETDRDLRCADVTRGLREELLRLTKAFPLPVTGLRGYEEAVVTQGGVSVKEIDPKTMACKKYEGLYFIGEVLDLDALTGGYNLQIAWSTAAQAAAAILSQEE